MINPQTRAPMGLGRLGTAVVLILLLVGSALLMHTLAGHTSTHTSTASHSHETAAAHSTSVTPAPSAALTSADDCGGLCAMLCAIMGMACLMVLALFAWSLLRRTGNRALFVLSRALSAAAVLPRLVLPRAAPDLAQLSIIRI